VGVYVHLAIYDIMGRLVETLVNKSQEPGVYQVEWDRKDQSRGVYFYLLAIGKGEVISPRQDESIPYIDTKKMTFLH